MNLKIKCDTPKEQVLVLRKFKKLVPECKWGGYNVFDFIPFTDRKNSETQSVYLYLEGNKIDFDWYGDDIESCMHYPTFPAFDFLRDDWKLQSDNKSEIKAKIQSLETQLNELKSLIDQ